MGVIGGGPFWAFRLECWRGVYGVIYRGFLGEAVARETATHFFGLRPPVGLRLLRASLFAVVALNFVLCLVAGKWHEQQVASGFFLGLWCFCCCGGRCACILWVQSRRCFEAHHLERARARRNTAERSVRNNASLPPYFCALRLAAASPLPFCGQRGAF